MPSDQYAIDSEELWRRVGLEQLHGATTQVQEHIRQFEQALRALPPCHACARRALLERLDAAGGRLGRELAGVSMIAKALQDAVAAAERTREALAAGAPEPCRCGQGPCICHE